MECLNKTEPHVFPFFLFFRGCAVDEKFVDILKKRERKEKYLVQEIEELVVSCCPVMRFDWSRHSGLKEGDKEARNVVGWWGENQEEVKQSATQWKCDSSHKKRRWSFTNNVVHIGNSVRAFSLSFFLLRGRNTHFLFWQPTKDPAGHGGTWPSSFVSYTFLLFTFLLASFFFLVFTVGCSTHSLSSDYHHSIMYETRIKVK